MQNMQCQTGGTRSGEARFDIFFVTLNTFNMSNMSNMSTSRALRRSALYRCCGHVCPRHSRDIDSVLIVQRTTNSVAECGTASVLIKGKGSGNHMYNVFNMFQMAICRISGVHFTPLFSYVLYASKCQKCLVCIICKI